MKILYLPIVCAAGALAAAGCGGTADPSPPTPPKHVSPYSIASGANVTDTVLARLAQPLVVLVQTETGVPRPGVAVRFDAVPTADTARRAERTVVVASRQTALFSGSVVDTTDAQGHASVLVQLGTIAGNARVAVEIPGSFSDTANFTVRSGAPVSMTLSIHDTTIFAGESFPLGASLRDRWGNISTQVPTFALTSLGGNAVTVDTDATVHATGSFGRAKIVVQGAGRTDSAFVGVVPSATIAVYDNSTPTLKITRLNGTGVVRFDKLVSALFAAPNNPEWSPDGSRILLTMQSHDETALYLTDTAGNYTPVVLKAFPSKLSAGHFSRDGQWVYYSKNSLGNSQILRVHPTGGSPELLFTSTELAQSPMPVDGGAQLIVETTDGAGGLMAARLDLNQQTITRLAGAGGNPAYSATANLVVTTGPDGRLLLMRPDGSELRPLGTSTSGPNWAGSLSLPVWSPDGQWILAKGSSLGRYVVVRVADGFAVPLTIGTQLGWASWRP